METKLHQLLIQFPCRYLNSCEAKETVLYFLGSSANLCMPEVTAAHQHKTMK